VPCALSEEVGHHLAVRLVECHAAVVGVKFVAIIPKLPEEALELGLVFGTDGGWFGDN
jgi:hypothetical protein